jgi:hypothetical protein
VNGGAVVLSGANTYNGGTDIRGVVEQGSDTPNGGVLFAASNDALGTGPVQMFRGILVIQPGVTIGNPIEFVEGGIVANEGTLNNSITDSFNVAQVVINLGTINGSVLLGGAHDIVQLVTGSRCLFPGLKPRAESCSPFGGKDSLDYFNCQLFPGGARAIS